jgi:SAM-dependent MidA family methyltransferase
MFGELVGLALAQAWIDAGQPSPSTLLELGPGRGTLMADILRATKRIPGFHAAITITLCEASPKLRDIQQQTLVGYDVTWITDLTQLDDAPLFCVANEFFDALPIRQFQRDGSHWHERTVGLQQDALCFGLSKSPTDLPQLMARLNDTSQGDIVEICQQAVTICDQIGQVINAQGGLALIFDYGDWRSLGETLQAVQNHAYCDPLQTPGQADITAQVDFEALAQATPSAYSRVTPPRCLVGTAGNHRTRTDIGAQFIGRCLGSPHTSTSPLDAPRRNGDTIQSYGVISKNCQTSRRV